MFGGGVLLPHAADLELTGGKLMKAPEYMPLGELTYVDRANNLSFEFAVKHVESKPFANGCDATVVRRALTSPSRRIACYEHFQETLSTQFLHGDLLYTVVVNDPAEPRGTGPSATTRWLERLLDSYA
jgi:hypothetical protein